MFVCLFCFLVGGGWVGYQVFMSSDFNKTITLTVPRVKLVIHFTKCARCNYVNINSKDIPTAIHNLKK